MFDLTFLGTSASVPSADRNHPGLLVEAGGHRVMIDCGEGTQRQLLRVLPSCAPKAWPFRAGSRRAPTQYLLALSGLSNADRVRGASLSTCFRIGNLASCTSRPPP
jgi:hypothetical protein